MIILGFDTETTGLHRENDRIIEVGSVLYSTGQKRVLEASSYLVKSDVPVSERITKLTGITQSAINKYGYDSRNALDAFLDMVEQADAFVGQNVIRFDKPFLENWARREKLVIPDKLWIDTMTDIPGIIGKHLGYQAADHGFLNLFPHGALSDVQTVLKIIEMHDIDKIVERAKSPTVVLLSRQSMADNQLARERKFRFNYEYKVWWRTVKQMDVDEIVKEAPFDISFAPPEILIEKLWYD